MYAAERQQEIVQIARRDGRVDVAELAAMLQVTTETIRRDLTRLERQGLVRRVHGGALPVERFPREADVSERSEAMEAEKERIAKAALAEVPDRGAILLDAGTTTAALAATIPDDRDLTVVTNALPIALSLATRPRLTVLSLGGRLRSTTLACVDRWAVGALADVVLDVSFIATNGVSPGRGLTTPDPAEAEVKRAMVAAGKRVVLLADHTKVGADHFARFATLDQIDLLITDTGLDEGIAAELEAAGPEVRRA